MLVSFLDKGPEEQGSQESHLTWSGAIGRRGRLRTAPPIMVVNFGATREAVSGSGATNRQELERLIALHAPAQL